MRTAARCAALLFAALASITVLNAQSSYTTPYAISTHAGFAGARGSTDGTGSAARFSAPQGVAVDGAGNLYIADGGNQTIRKITPGGVVTTLAGSPMSAGSTDGTGSAARFRNPLGVAVDGAGNVYVTDNQNQTIRKITPGGVVTTLAGAPLSAGSANGPGATARFFGPFGIAVDSSGNVYVSENGNCTIRKITPDGMVSTFAGSVGGMGSANGTGSAAQFRNPEGLAMDADGNLYVADTINFTIRKITPGAVVTTLAGSPGSVGSADGAGSAARFNYPYGVGADAAGNVYVADTGNETIRKITPAGVVTTLAGRVQAFASADGTGSAAGFAQPWALAADAAGKIYVADTGNQTVRKGVLLTTDNFNSTGQNHILWQNASTGDRGFWLTNSTTFSSWVDVGVISTDWRIAATADFDGDGQVDILWENASTGVRGFWLMNGTTFVRWADLGFMSADWHIAGTGDFNGDGKPDIFWENTVTGERRVWLMDGTALLSSVTLAIVPVEWRMVGAADFNGDGFPDLLWENTLTGDRYCWFLNGTTTIGAFYLGNVSPDWHIAAVRDFNADGQPDILWENTATGDRGVWLMNGTSFSSWVDIGVVSTDWRIAP